MEQGLTTPPPAPDEETARTALLRDFNDAFRKGLAPAEDGALPHEVEVKRHGPLDIVPDPQTLAEAVRAVAADTHPRDAKAHASGTVRVDMWTVRWLIYYCHEDGCRLGSCHDDPRTVRRELYMMLIPRMGIAS